jgi:hypothetical protein
MDLNPIAAMSMCWLRPGALRGVGLNYFGFADELGEILGHRVDFCSQLHPALREPVEREAVKLYECP